MGDEKRSVLIVTVSDSVSAGTREDRSGTLAAAAMEAHGWEVSRATVPDERDQISALLGERALPRLELGSQFRDVSPVWPQLRQGDHLFQKPRHGLALNRIANRLFQRL